jgi:Cyclin, N-terminal domain
MLSQNLNTTSNEREGRREVQRAAHSAMKYETNEEMSLLSLRMKPTESEQLACYDYTLDCLDVLTAQDALYKARDYIGRRRKRGVNEVNTSPDETVDPACREKMCEWSYRICDHFDTSREIVAFAFSFLDRFIDRCSCDRTAFKLAAMTSLYIATKMLNVKQLSIASLCELSRGEFQAEHIAQMERIILTTLDYRMNPPTVQAFIQQLRALFPSMDAMVADAIYKRAIFYAELSVYDYAFVTEHRYQIAVACILNAFLDIEGEYISEQLQDEFLSTLSTSLCVEVDFAALEQTQGRLWYLYGCSAESQFDGVHHHTNYPEGTVKCSPTEQFENFAYSPVSVVPKGRVTGLVQGGFCVELLD